MAWTHCSELLLPKSQSTANHMRRSNCQWFSSSMPLHEEDGRTCGCVRLTSKALASRFIASNVRLRHWSSHEIGCRWVAVCCRGDSSLNSDSSIAYSCSRGSNSSGSGSGTAVKALSISEMWPDLMIEEEPKSKNLALHR